MEKISIKNMKKTFGVSFKDFSDNKSFFIKHQKFTKFGTRYYNPSTIKKNIVCCGCSMAWGLDVEYNESYSYVLNRIINYKENNYQVLNIGYPGAGLKWVIRWFELLYKNLNPHMCILHIPDIFRQPFLDLQEDHIIFHSYNYGVGALLERNYIRIFEVFKNHKILIQNQINELYKFIIFLRSRNIIPIIIILYPYHNNFFSSKRLIEKKIRSIYLEHVIKLLRKEKVLIINVNKNENFYKIKDKINLMTVGGHYSIAGNIVVAKKIAKDIFDIDNYGDFKFI